MNRLACAARHRTASRRHNDDVRDPYGTWSWRSPGASVTARANPATLNQQRRHLIQQKRYGQDRPLAWRRMAYQDRVRQWQGCAKTPRAGGRPRICSKHAFPEFRFLRFLRHHRPTAIASSRDRENGKTVSRSPTRMVGRLRDMRRVSSHCQPNPPKHERCCLAAERRTGCGRMKG
jgi:hypothetical protein